MLRRTFDDVLGRMLAPDFAISAANFAVAFTATITFSTVPTLSRMRLTSSVPVASEPIAKLRMMVTTAPAATSPMPTPTTRMAAVPEKSVFQGETANSSSAWPSDLYHGTASLLVHFS